MIWFVRNRRAKITVAGFAASTFVALLAVVAVVAVVWDGLQDELGKADVALVLGNTVFPDGTPSPRLAARLERALELYREGYFPLIVVSGGLGKEGHDEAVVMRDYLTARGVPAGSILVDSKGLDTFKSARNTLQIMQQRGLKTVFVITQYFHIPRSKLALKKFGVATVYSAHARYFEWRDLYSTGREVLGVVKYVFRSYEDTGREGKPQR